MGTQEYVIVGRADDISKKNIHQINETQVTLIKIKSNDQTLNVSFVHYLVRSQISSPPLPFGHSQTDLHVLRPWQQARLLKG